MHNLAFQRYATILVILLFPITVNAQTFVQANSNPTAVNTNTVVVPYTTAETAGDLNVVVIGWGDTSSVVTSVNDDNANVYTLAANTIAANGVSQAIYYSPAITVGTTTTPNVTVTFNQAAFAPDVRISEYSGLSAAPLDTSIGASGNGTAADSGGATTTGFTDLIFGAGTVDKSFSAGGFSHVIINTPFHDIVEDEDVITNSSYHATATAASGSNWVMHMVGFSTNTLPPTVTTVTGIAPPTGPDSGGTPVTITGTGFAQGATVLIQGLPATNCTVSSATTIACTTPSGSVGGADVSVTDPNSVPSTDAGAFTYTASTPTITSIVPPTGPTNGATPITIQGTNFVGSRVTISGIEAIGVNVGNGGMSISATTPASAVGSANVVVTNSDGGTVTSVGGFTYSLGNGPINFIQRADSGAAPPSSATATVALASQIVGDTNIVIIGWNDQTAAVSNVVDSAGSTYKQALPTTVGHTLSQTIYYAPITTGGANTITVTFNTAASFPDVRVLEYQGLDPTSPLDMGAGAATGQTGAGKNADSGPISTSTANEVIIGAGTTDTFFTGPGGNFVTTAQTVNGDTAEHEITTFRSSGVDATATLTNNVSNWVMQAAAFHTPVTVFTPDFTMDASPNLASVMPGNPAVYTVTVAPINGFVGTVELTCSVLPAGGNCSFNPPMVTPGGTPVNSTLTLSTTSLTPPDEYLIGTVGSSGSLQHSALITLNVLATDFTLSAAPGSAFVNPGKSANYTLTIAAKGSPATAVSLSPSCVIGDFVCSVTPSTVTPPATATMTVSAGKSALPGSYSIGILGASGALGHETSANLVVTDFSVNITPSTISIPPGQTAVYVLSLQGSAEFNGSVALGCSVTPNFPTCSISPSNIAVGSTPVTTNVLVHTAAGTPLGSLTGTPKFPPQSFALASLIMVCICAGCYRTKTARTVVLFFVISLLYTSCGGGGGDSSSSSPGSTQQATPAGTYTVTITATSGIQHTTTTMLQVQ